MKVSAAAMPIQVIVSRLGITSDSSGCCGDAKGYSRALSCLDAFASRNWVDRGTRSYEEPYSQNHQGRQKSP